MLVSCALSAGNDGVVDEVQLAGFVEAVGLEYVPHDDLADRQLEQRGGDARVSQFAAADRALNDIAAVAPPRFERGDPHGLGDGWIFLSGREQTRERARVLGRRQLRHQADQHQQVFPKTLCPGRQLRVLLGCRNQRGAHQRGFVRPAPIDRRLA